MVPSELKWHIMPNEKSGDEFKPFVEGLNGTFRIFSGYGAKKVFSRLELTKEKCHQAG